MSASATAMFATGQEKDLSVGLDWQSLGMQKPNGCNRTRRSLLDENTKARRAYPGFSTSILITL
jgi:hypothetical protein